MALEVKLVLIGRLVVQSWLLQSTCQSDIGQVAEAKVGPDTFVRVLLLVRKHCRLVLFIRSNDLSLGGTVVSTVTC